MTYYACVYRNRDKVTDCGNWHNSREEALAIAKRVESYYAAYDGYKLAYLIVVHMKPGADEHR